MLLKLMQIVIPKELLSNHWFDLNSCPCFPVLSLWLQLHSLSLYLCLIFFCFLSHIAMLSQALGSLFPCLYAPLIVSHFFDLSGVLFTAYFLLFWPMPPSHTVMNPNDMHVGFAEFCEVYLSIIVSEMGPGFLWWRKLHNYSFILCAGLSVVITTSVYSSKDQFPRAIFLDLHASSHG